MKRTMLFMVVAAMCALLVVSMVGCAPQNGGTKAGQEKNVQQVKGNFVPSPVFSPPYPPLPHHFSDVYTIQVLCRAPQGAIARALPEPLEPVGDGDLYILLLAWTQDVNKEGYNVHEIAINAPVKWKDKVGCTTIIEYIDSDMGLLAGREVYGWPKKMAVIEWTQNKTGWKVTANKMKDQKGIPLMKVEFKESAAAPAPEYPSMMPTLLVRRIPNASATTPAFFQMVCVGCNMPQGDNPPEGDNPPPGDNPLAAAAPEKKGIATVEFFDGPHDPLTFLGPSEVLGAKMSILEGEMPFGLGLGDVLDQWEVMYVK